MGTRLHGNTGDSVGTGTTPREQGIPRKWGDSTGMEALCGTGETPSGKGTTPQERGRGDSGEQVGLARKRLSGNRWDSRERNSAGKEFCGKRNSTGKELRIQEGTLK